MNHIKPIQEKLEFADVSCFKLLSVVFSQVDGITLFLVLVKKWKHSARRVLAKKSMYAHIIWSLCYTSL